MSIPFNIIINNYNNHNSLISQIKTTNHKLISVWYIVFGMLNAIVGITYSLIVRLELFNTGSKIVSSSNINFYNFDITLHGIIMLLFVVVPILFGGLGNYYVPINIGNPEIIFPRINNLSLTFLALSVIICLLTFLVEYSVGPGWTMYPPLSLFPINTTLILILVLAFVGTSSLLGSFNYCLTVLHTLIFSDLFLVAVIITSLMLIVILPILTGGLLLVLSDMTINTLFFKGVINGLSGDAVLYQHLFWLFGHPEVYVIILPAFGVISQGLSTFSQLTIFGYNSMILALISIAIVGDIVWSHHMFTVGMEVESVIYYTIASLVIAIPTGTKIYNWLTMHINNNILILNLIVLFIIIFLSGGITGVILANNTLDIILHDSYYVVSHFHFILSIAAILGTLIGLIILYQLYNIIYVEVLLVILISMIGTFLPQYYTGFSGQPRRMPDYATALEGLNSMSSICSLSTIIALFILFPRSNTVK